MGRGCGREENEPAARWKKLGVEGRGGGGYVDVGPVFSLVAAAGGHDPEAWFLITVGVGRVAIEVWL